jgi:tetratricopeptide (TPR) repeat protein
VRTAALLLLAAFAAAQARPDDAEIAAGRKAFEAGNYDEAVACFARARALAPDDWRGHAYQSLTLIQQAQGDTSRRRREVLLREAELIAGELVKRDLVDFHDPLYRLIKGLVYSLEGDHGKAYTVLGEALRAPREKFAPYDEIELHKMVQRAFAVSAIRVALHLITQGKFQQAEIELENASRGLPEDDPERRMLERLFAAVSENVNKLDKAIAHLRTCIELSKADPVAVEELTGTIALIYLNHEEIEKGREVLAEAPKESRQVDVVVARCTLACKDALRERGTRLDEAMAYVREAMRSCPPENVYRLVVIYRDLLLTKVGIREAQTPEGQALLKEAIPILEREIDRRPECPQLYFALYRIHKLLGNAEQERRYQDLHDRKKKDFEHLEKYDQHGWPRCGN